ncbi:KpsF/GutQ family sugar-phosphate isomerase [Caulobacter flavus]|jgi:arabinose-5-phosphate isomerase|uniref:KpsF/GutQ family sugar-phosphate isomerase n=1 Tax=Caulobacter flavus TaxID=1679497 RepID=A0A2N5CQE2_9CAUL|nr:KpsF/GutQ family sugar-phosphate isomerase [Caulobacter flavus]AYV46298.1 KpsF/GutQ family sugar-phosphate isomerase [Caulobacter flavus]PLR10018.1 KpsF/GutQ family sugar-phosphate isomerase [Caulobacter flavus]
MTDTISDAVAVGRRVLSIEAQALTQMADELGEAFARAVQVMHDAKGRIVCTGMGKSGHVARKIAATLASTGSQAMFVHPAEASHGDLGMIGPDDVVLALSKSGEARELADTLAYCKRFSIPLIAITAVATSQLGKAGDVLLLLPDAPEATAEVNAPTTSTTLQIALGDALAVALLESRGFTASDFRVFHPGGKLGAVLRTAADLMHGGDELPLVGEGAPMSEALLVMSQKRFGAVGVTDAAGALIGLITDGDLRRHMDGLMGHTAGEVMTRDPRVIGPHALAAEALKVMNERRITVLFVVEAGQPVGVLHVHDLLRAGVI